MSEGFKPLYDEDGKVNDPRVAEQMAEREDIARQYDTKTQEEIDLVTHKTGEDARIDLIQYNYRLEDTAKLIKAALSESEIRLIDGIVSENDTESMKTLLSKIVKA